MKERLVRTRIRIVSQFPWLAYTVFHTPLVESEEYPTMATNGDRIFYNREFCERLSDKELAAVYLHELLHILFDHMGRMKDKDQMRWNIATDAVINSFVEKYYKLPEGVVTMESLGYNGVKTSEAVYEFLRNQNLGQFVTFDVHIPGPSHGVSNEHITAAKLRGDIPGDLMEEIKLLEVGKIDWRKLLATTISSQNKSDFTWNRPNRRIPDIYLPSMIGYSIDSVVIVVDVSGSISSEQLNKFFAEVRNICKTFNTSVKVITADAKVQDVFEFTGQSVVKVKGRGGTDFTEALQVAEKLARIILVFTDGYFATKYKPHAKVYWILTQKQYFPAEVDFGTKVYFE